LDIISNLKFTVMQPKVELFYDSYKNYAENLYWEIRGDSYD